MKARHANLQQRRCITCEFLVMLIERRETERRHRLSSGRRSSRANCRAALSASMMAVRDRIQRERHVVQLVVQRIKDLSPGLDSIEIPGRRVSVAARPQ